MPKRSYSAAGSYRYGFNGKENDNEVKGLGNQQDYGMRIYDSRVGRFLSVDPIAASFPWNSTYAYSEDDPVNYVDLDGMEKTGASATQVQAPTTPALQLGNLYEIDKQGNLINRTQLFRDYVPSGLGSQMAPFQRFVTPKELEAMIPPNATHVSITPDGKQLYITGANGNSFYRSLLIVETPRPALTWVDRAIINLYNETIKKQTTFVTQWNVSVQAYEIITNDPSTLPDDYLEEVKQRIASGKETDRDKIYANEIRRRQAKYQINDKHNPSMPMGGSNASIIPANHQQLWERRSHYDEKTDTWWTREGDGKKAVYHRFSSDNNGTYHWSGSTGDNFNRAGRRVEPILQDKVPVEIKRQ